jgi:hypothetical protein
MVSPGEWLISSVLFFCLPVELKLWGEVALADHVGWSELLISSADSCVTLQLQLLGQLLPQQGGAVQIWMLPSASGDQLCRPLIALLWRGFLLCLFTGFPQWRFISLPFHLSLGQVQCGVPKAPSTLSVLWLFTVCFQFCGPVWLWVLLTGSGNELCGLLPTLLLGVAYRLPFSTFLPFQCLFTDCSRWD